MWFINTLATIAAVWAYFAIWLLFCFAAIMAMGISAMATFSLWSAIRKLFKRK